LYQKASGKITFPLDSPDNVISHILDEILKEESPEHISVTFKNGTKNENAENTADFDLLNQSADSV
jgi:hypothetical protein